MNELTVIPNEIKEFSMLEQVQNITTNFNLSEVILKIKEKAKEINQLKEDKERYDKMGWFDKHWAKSEMEEKIKNSILLTHELSEIQTQMNLYNIFVAKSICNHQNILLKQSDKIRKNFKIMIKHDKRIFETLENQNIFNKITMRLNEEISVIQENAEKYNKEVNSINSEINDLSKKYDTQNIEINRIKEEIIKISQNTNKEPITNKSVYIFFIINLIISITAIVICLKK